MMSEESANNSNLLGSFIRAQRQMANLSLRDLSAMTEVSNPYLSQIERGLSEPSARVLKSIAEALNISAEALFAQAGLMTESDRLRRQCNGNRIAHGHPAHRAAEACAARCVPQLYRSKWQWDSGRFGGYLTSSG